MSYTTYRKTKRWTPLNAVYRPGPKPSHRAANFQHTGGKAARRLTFDHRKFEQLMNDLSAYERDDVDCPGEENTDVQLVARKTPGEIAEVVVVKAEGEKEASEEEDEDDECHYGLMMCMHF